MAVLFPDAIERPDHDTPAVVSAAMDRLVSDVMKWLAGKGSKDDDPDEVREQLAKAIDGSWMCDGYETAYELDRAGWSPDAELVEILDWWSGLLSSAAHQAEKAWAKEVNPQPSHKIGDRVRAKWGSAKKIVEGEIVRIDQDQAHYTVRRAEDAPRCGAVVNYEDVIDAPAPN